MLKLLASSIALALSALAGCQPSVPASTSVPTAPPATTSAAPAPGASTTDAARAAVARYIQALPNAALYVPDSARVTDNAATWQVLVPRTDWVGRMPNRARFEVDKQTGKVSGQPVK